MNRAVVPDEWPVVGRMRWRVLSEGEVWLHDPKRNRTAVASTLKLAFLKLTENR